MDEGGPKWTAPRNHNRSERECRGVGRYIFITKKLFFRNYADYAETVSGELVDFQ